MEYNRRYYLKHPEGFCDRAFSCFGACCNVWRAEIESYIANWDYLSPYNDMSAPDYVFAEPARWKRKGVVLAVGGNTHYAAIKYFEEEFPKKLYQYFPLWFQLRLQTGQDGGPFDSELRWFRLHSWSQARSLKNNPIFRRPKGGWKAEIPSSEK